jgi:hypothetical protein
MSRMRFELADPGLFDFPPLQVHQDSGGDDDDDDEEGEGEGEDEDEDEDEDNTDSDGYSE